MRVEVHGYTRRVGSQLNSAVPSYVMGTLTDTVSERRFLSCLVAALMDLDGAFAHEETERQVQRCLRGLKGND